MANIMSMFIISMRFRLLLPTHCDLERMAVMLDMIYNYNDIKIMWILIDITHVCILVNHDKSAFVHVQISIWKIVIINSLTAWSTVRQQAITWTSDFHYLCCHMTSLSFNESTVTIPPYLIGLCKTMTLTPATCFTGPISQTNFYHNYTPRTTKLLGGILVSLRPSVRLSVCPSVRPSVRPSRMPCPLCIIFSYGWILFILGTNDHYHERVCRAPWPLTLTYIFKVIWPWLRKSCPLCSVYSSGWILPIFGTNDHYY